MPTEPMPTKKLSRASKRSKTSGKITWANRIRLRFRADPEPEAQAKNEAEAEPELKTKVGAEANLGAKAKLTAIIDALETLANAWSALDEDQPLRRSVDDHLAGCLGVTSWRSSIPGEWDAAARSRHLAWISEKYETKLRISKFIDEDLPRLVADINELILLLNECTAREPAEYLRLGVSTRLDGCRRTSAKLYQKQAGGQRCPRDEISAPPEENATGGDQH